MVQACMSTPRNACGFVILLHCIGSILICYFNLVYDNKRTNLNESCTGTFLVILDVLFHSKKSYLVKICDLLSGVR